MNSNEISPSEKIFDKNVLPYLYLLRSEFWEVNDFINNLKSYQPFILDVRESTPIQNALNIAVVVSYARNFKKSLGYSNYNLINEEIIKSFSTKEKEFHQIVIDWRDQEYAHSDALPNDIQLDEDGGYSRRVVRQLLEKDQLDMLKVMVNKIRIEIENIIKGIK